MQKIVILIILFSINLSAKEMCSDFFTKPTEYLFGLEFTFTNENIINEGNVNPKDYGLAKNPIKAVAWVKWLEIVKDKCAKSPDCITFMSSDKHGDALAVQFNDNFKFTIGIDSAALEINATPYSRTEFSKVKERMQDYVFNTAQLANLRPHERAGQGHIHISTEAFKNGTHLRNFFVDFQNRPEIIYGALGNHLYNSPPLAAQKKEQRNQLTEVLKNLDSRFFGYSIGEFANKINTEVYTSTVAKDWGGESYYQAFNMTRVAYFSKKSTVEIRSFRPQQNPDIYILETILLERWVEKLRLVKNPISYLNEDKYEYSSQEIVNGYYQLIKDLDLPWEHFKVLLLERYQHIKPDQL